MIEREISIDNLSVFIRQSEETDRKLLMLHGWRGTSKVWVDNISQLAAKFECVACDLPGFGQSENPSNAWGVNEYSGFVRKLIAQLGWERFCLIGKSFGGRVAIKYAVDYASTLEGLVLVDTAGTEPKSSPTRIKIFLAQIGRRVVRSLPLSKQDNLRKLYYNIIGLSVESSELRQEIKKKVTSEDLTYLLGLISTPTLVVWGENDTILPVEVGRKIAHSIPSASFELISGAGHDAHQTHSEVFNTKVQSFLYKLR